MQAEEYITDIVICQLRNNVLILTMDAVCGKVAGKSRRMSRSVLAYMTAKTSADLPRDYPQCAIVSMIASQQMGQ